MTVPKIKYCNSVAILKYYCNFAALKRRYELGKNA
jgi:hypothetical protein